jgi:hypothetical protein
LSGRTADRLAETLVSEHAANRAAERGTDLPEQIAKEALRRKLLSCQKPDRLRHHGRSVDLCIHISFSSVAVITRHGCIYPSDKRIGRSV